MGFGRFGASFLILVFLATAVSAWTDFVENGSFETGDLTSWDRFKASGGHAFADVYTDFATDGNFAARLSVTELILWGYGWVSIRSQQTTVHNDDIVCFDMTRIGQEGFYYLLLCVNENCEKHSLSCSGGGLQNYNGAVNYDPNLSAHCAKVINAPPEGGLIGIKAVGAHCSRTYTATFHIDKVRVVRTPPRIMNILREPADPIFLDDVKVTVSLSGHNFRNASLHYSINGIEQTPLLMLEDANGNFIAMIPKQAVSTQVSYFISVNDGDRVSNTAYYKVLNSRQGFATNYSFETGNLQHWSFGDAYTGNGDVGIKFDDTNTYAKDGFYYAQLEHADASTATTDFIQSQVDDIGPLDTVCFWMAIDPPHGSAPGNHYTVFVCPNGPNFLGWYTNMQNCALVGASPQNAESYRYCATLPETATPGKLTITINDDGGAGYCNNPFSPPCAVKYRIDDIRIQRYSVTPEIESITQNPEYPTYLDDVTVSAKISGTVEKAELHYWLNNSPQTPIEMQLVAGNYEATITKQPIATKVKYKIVVNEGEVESQEFEYWSVHRNLKIALILLKYADVSFTPSTSYVHDKIGFVEDYYLSELASNGALRTILKVEDNNGNLYTLPKTFSEYMAIFDYDKRIDAFWVDTVAISDQKINFEEYDGFISLDNGLDNNFVGGGTAIVARAGNEAAYIATTEGPKPAIYLRGDAIDIVWAHEIGHMLGLADLYPESGFSEGDIGIWGLMGYSAPNIVQPVSSWSRNFLNWQRIPSIFESPPVLWSRNDTLISLTDKKFGDLLDVAYTDIFGIGRYILEARKNESTPLPHLGLEGVQLYFAFLNKVEALQPQGISDPDLVRLTPTLTADKASYIDILRFYKFEYLGDSDTGGLFRPQIKIGRSLDISDLIGLAVQNSQNVSGFFNSSAEFESFGPDVDLHAYSYDGNHIGINYETGEFENEITGAYASGDMVIEEEWIFVPTNIPVTFKVTSKDFDEFVNHVSLDPESTVMDFNVQFIFYGENPRIVLDDFNNGVVEDRFEYETRTFPIRFGEERKILIQANINFDPDTLIKNDALDLNQFVTVYIEIEDENISASNINLSTILLNGVIPAVDDPFYGFVKAPEIIDRDEDGFPELMVKFYRYPTKQLLQVGEQPIIITGTLADGTYFKGNDSIMVIDKTKP